MYGSKQMEWQKFKDYVLLYHLFHDPELLEKVKKQYRIWRDI